jgi:hypothetical protein
MPANKRRLLSKVRAIAGNHGLAGNIALPTFTSQTISPTLTRAETALFQY